MSAIDYQPGQKFHGQTVLHGIDLEVKAEKSSPLSARAAQGRQRYYAVLTCWNNHCGIKVGDIIIDTARPFSQQKG